MSTDFTRYSLPQLQQLSARIDKAIAKQEAESKVSALKKLRLMAREHGLTLEDVFGTAPQATPQKQAPASKLAAAPKAPLPIKFRHPSNKDLGWSGRGRRPSWVAAWLSTGGALDALAFAAQKFEKKQQRGAPVSTDPIPTGNRADAVYAE
jgi:DNA-binding protein H-NS